MISPRAAIVLGALMAASGVAAGAFGAHGLKKVLAAEQLASFDTAVRYQLIHALGLILLGLVASVQPSRGMQWASVAMLLGVLLFSGGIYGWLATAWRPLVHIVPVGGVLLIFAWLALAAAVLFGQPAGQTVGGGAADRSHPSTRN